MGQTNRGLLRQTEARDHLLTIPPPQFQAHRTPHRRRPRRTIKAKGRNSLARTRPSAVRFPKIRHRRQIRILSSRLPSGLVGEPSIPSLFRSLRSCELPLRQPLRFPGVEPRRRASSYLEFCSLLRKIALPLKESSHLIPFSQHQNFCGNTVPKVRNFTPETHPHVTPITVPTSTPSK